MHRIAFGSSAQPGQDALCARHGDAFRCVLVGALIDGKGHEDAILALALLRQKGIKAELLLAGDGSTAHQSHLQKIVRLHGLVRDVHFVGHVADPRRLMASADVILVCSRSEAFGRVTIEGMLSGTPVIGARAGATAELIVHGHNGLLYRPGDARDLAAEISYLFENPRIAVELANEAREWASVFFTRDRYRQEMVRLLASVRERRYSTTSPDRNCTAESSGGAQKASQQFSPLDEPRKQECE
jgi:glycosyltransferase involved in cell wall biosynthesis